MSVHVSVHMSVFLPLRVIGREAENTDIKKLIADVTPRGRCVRVVGHRWPTKRTHRLRPSTRLGALRPLSYSNFSSYLFHGFGSDFLAVVSALD